MSADYEVLGKVRQLFKAGDFEQLQTILQSKDTLAFAQSSKNRELFSIALSAGALGLLCPKTLTAWLKVIPAVLQPNLRYKAMIKCGLWKEAAVFRRAPERRSDLHFQRQCRIAAGSALLVAHKRKSGFKFHHHRMHGDSAYLQHIRRVFEYHPVYDKPEQVIFLEQGIGDRFLHLAHIKSHRPDTQLTFSVVERWQSILKWLFPNDKVESLPTVAPKRRIPANASGDYLVKAFRQTSSIAPTARFGSQIKNGPARFGITWHDRSRQHLRQEGKMELAHLLSLLPEDIELVSLQSKPLQDETALILQHPNILIPAFDPDTDLRAYAETISGLAGVIGVENAAVHVAGLFDVPSCTLVKPPAHWYWGPKQDVLSLYPKAKTVDLNTSESADIAGWVNDCKQAYEAYAPRVAKHMQTYPQRPVLVTGVARSGTSLTMGLLHESGLWTGKTVPGGPSNPDGYFENIGIRETVLKPILRDGLGSDPLGVEPLPPPAPCFTFPNLNGQVLETIKAEGYSNKQPWGYKDAKIALLWNIWAEAFPEAIWVIVSRNSEDVVRSCLRAHFMQRISTDPALWRRFHDAYSHRLEHLTEHLAGRAHSVKYEDLVHGDFSALEAICEKADLKWNPKKAEAFIRQRN